MARLIQPSRKATSSAAKKTEKPAANKKAPKTTTPKKAAKTTVKVSAPAVADTEKGANAVGDKKTGPKAVGAKKKVSKATAAKPVEKPSAAVEEQPNFGPCGCCNAVDDLENHLFNGKKVCFQCYQNIFPEKFIEE